MRQRLLTFGFVLVCSACSGEPTTDTPEGALELFLRAMQASEEDSSMRATAYELLASEARSRLAQRARIASSLSNRNFEPWEMIADGRYRLRFPPRRTGGFVTRMRDADHAMVLVRGEGEGERAEVVLVREHGAWRVALEVPEVARPRVTTDAGVVTSPSTPR